ncbi:hypothetical protein VPH35_008375 [Triticum aestivum]
MLPMMTPVVFFIKTAPRRTKAWRSRGCRRRATVDGGPELAKTMSIANIIKLESGGMELAGILPRAAEDGDTELTRMMPVIFFIKPAAWTTEAWNSRGCRYRAMVDSDTDLTSTTSSSWCHGEQRRGVCGTTPPMSTSSRRSLRPRATKTTHTPVLPAT